MQRQRVTKLLQRHRVRISFIDIFCVIERNLCDCSIFIFRMSLYHFKYIGKRQIATSAANGVGKPRTVKAMTLPARMAPPDFSADTPGTGTLQAHNTVARENLTENESGKLYQALLEANMATEVGLIALDCLGLYCIHFKVDIFHNLAIRILVARPKNLKNRL